MASTWHWADLLSGSSFHLFTSESGHHEMSLHLQHGDNTHAWGYCKDYKRAVCRLPLPLGRTVIADNASSTLQPHFPSFCFTHLTPSLTQLRPRGLLHATLAPTSVASHHHCPLLRPPHGSFFSCFQSPPGHFLADFLTIHLTATPPCTPALYHTALPHFPHSPSCYLPCQCRCIHLLVYCVSFYDLIGSFWLPGIKNGG